MKRLLIVLVAAVFLTACDRSTNDVQKSIKEVKQQYPVTVNSGNHTTTVTAKPTHIISLSPESTKKLKAINAGSLVTDMSADNPDIKKIVDSKPDLVITESDSSDFVKTMQSSNIEVLVQPPTTNPADEYKEIADLGALTDHAEDANRLAATMRQHQIAPNN